MERRLCCTRGRRREHGPRCQPYARHSKRQGATHELCHDLVHWRLRRPLNMTSNLDRGPLTTPKPLPAYRATAAPPRYHSPPKQLSPTKPTGPTLRALCTGDHRSPRTPNKLDREPLPPRRRCSLCADRATAAHPKQQAPPKRRGTHSERGAFTATSSCRHSPFLPRFFPVFTPSCSVFTPLLPCFYPVFTLFRFIVLPHFYPVFTLFLPRSAPSFLPPFLPHLRRVKCQTYPVFTPLLPHRQFLPSQAFYPGFTPFLVLCACRFPRFYPKGKTAHFLLVSMDVLPSVLCPIFFRMSLDQSAV